MEEMIKEEVQLFTDEIRKSEGEPFDNNFNLPILNALWNVTVGQRFDYNDPKLISIIERLTKRQAHPASFLVLIYPRIFKLFPKFLEYLQPIPGHQPRNLGYDQGDSQGARGDYRPE